ncbi:DMT family transporter [Adlercreutzia sp. R25]|uniref:DMT family transporter n=1 Tax=Adlercreutzia shanghongiae TaxID=3111773 RepID=UPI002DBD0E2D|nr:DMT family transporter [Adlercreutzia sp. R25]MEC4272304.1 DMT family transporter [Adlercreutzia sp. R25]
MGPSGRFWRGVVFALAGATLWGFSGACIQFLAENCDISSAFISAVRAAVAAVLFAAFALATRREALLSLVGSAAARPTLVLFGVGLYLSQITYAVSVALTNAGTATVLQATCTVFVMLFTCLRARRLPQLTDFAGLVCALVAAALIATQGDWGVIVLPVAGLVWGIANALSEALYIMAPQRLYDHWDRLAIIACGMVIGGVASLLVWLAGEGVVALLATDAGPAQAASAAGAGGSAASVSAAVVPTLLADIFGSGGGFIPQLDAVGWIVLVGGVGVLGTFTAFGLFLYGVSLVGSVKGSLLGVAEPAGAMVIAALWLQTPFSAADWTGLLLMAAMIVLVSLSGRSSKDQRAGTPRGEAIG